MLGPKGWGRNRKVAVTMGNFGIQESLGKKSGTPNKWGDGHHQNQTDLRKKRTEQVGGFNPSEKHARQIGSFPQIRGKNKTHLKPPPSEVFFFFEVIMSELKKWFHVKTTCVMGVMQSKYINPTCWWWSQLSNAMVLGVPNKKKLQPSRDSTAFWGGANTSQQRGWRWEFPESSWFKIPDSLQGTCHKHTGSACLPCMFSPAQRW